jgi:Ser/Thr protein kinase RdoA (MazF antagonist)
LTPDLLLSAVESVGLVCDGRLLGLNSYENRVYQVGIEDAKPVVAKFYRPERWSDAAILEEHAFTTELAQREIPVVAPLVFNAATLHQHGGFRFALFPRRGGRAPELEDPDVLEWLGRFLGRIHALGATKPFLHRAALDVETFGNEPRRFLMASGFVPDDLRAAYDSVTAQALESVQSCFSRAGAVGSLRLHGDCHGGNILWTDDGPHFVDFDDARMGPAVQDLWMLLSGDRDQMTRQLRDVLAGYEDFCEFNLRELNLIEALRTLRMIHYSAWLARRWDDPAFPRAFTWFNTERYWEEQILALREQIALMQDGPLQLGP